MTTKQPSTAPVLPGFTSLRYVGGGGFADVFVYEQHMPNRQVAVKVMKGAAVEGEARRRQFTAEANLMARVSTHPYIVTIFHADVAGDGRPYIIMEYYPGQNFLERARSERIGVAEVLRVGIQIGSALETAHRAGIVHRDIKPANILTSEYRRPGLADFGIASTSHTHADDTGGVSIPWAPPEAFRDDELGVSADVYSLGATMFHLLAGRSPFEVPGGDNSSIALVSRIERQPVPSTGRPDVPESLHLVLAQAMAKEARHRPPSVAELLRRLQAIESELQLAVTPLELADTGVAPRALVDTDDEATRVRGITEVQAQAPRGSIDHVPEAPTFDGSVGATRQRVMMGAPVVADTVHRRPALADDGDLSAAGPSPAAARRSKLLVGAGAVVLCGAAVGAIALSSGGPDDAATVTVAPTAVVVIGSTRPEPVNAGTAMLDAGGVATFTWSADTTVDDLYFVTRADTKAVVTTRETKVVLQEAPADLCVTIVVHRDREQDSDPTEMCVTP